MIRQRLKLKSDMPVFFCPAFMVVYGDKAGKRGLNKKRTQQKKAKKQDVPFRIAFFDLSQSAHCHRSRLFNRVTVYEIITQKSKLSRTRLCATFFRGGASRMRIAEGQKGARPSDHQALPLLCLFDFFD